MHYAPGLARMQVLLQVGAAQRESTLAPSSSPTSSRSLAAGILPGGYRRREVLLRCLPEPGGEVHPGGLGGGADPRRELGDRAEPEVLRSAAERQPGVHLPAGPERLVVVVHAPAAGPVLAAAVDGLILAVR